MVLLKSGVLHLLVCVTTHSKFCVVLWKWSPIWLSSQHKWTPVFAAAWRGHREVVTYLLEDALCTKDVTDVVSCVCTVLCAFCCFDCHSFG